MFRESNTCSRLWSDLTDLSSSQSTFVQHLGEVATVYWLEPKAVSEDSVSAACNYDVMWTIGQGRYSE